MYRASSARPAILRGQTGHMRPWQSHRKYWPLKASIASELATPSASPNGCNQPRFPMEIKSFSNGIQIVFQWKSKRFPMEIKSFSNGNRGRPQRVWSPVPRVLGDTARRSFTPRKCACTSISRALAANTVPPQPPPFRPNRLRDAQCPPLLLIGSNKTPLMSRLRNVSNKKCTEEVING